MKPAGSGTEEDFIDAIVDLDARDDVYTRPLDSIDLSVPELYQNDPINPISNGCAARTRCITAPTANSGRFGR